MLDKDRLETVIEVLEGMTDSNFTARLYIHGPGDLRQRCQGLVDGRPGYKGCIAGVCLALALLERDGRGVDSDDEWHEAARWLGLDWEEGFELFFAKSLEPDKPRVGVLESITSREALSVLMRLRDRGTIDWTAAREAIRELA